MKTPPGEWKDRHDQEGRLAAGFRSVRPQGLVHFGNYVYGSCGLEALEGERVYVEVATSPSRVSVTYTPKSGEPRQWFLDPIPGVERQSARDWLAAFLRRLGHSLGLRRAYRTRVAADKDGFDIVLRTTDGVDIRAGFYIHREHLYVEVRGLSEPVVRPAVGDGMRPFRTYRRPHVAEKAVADLIWYAVQHVRAARTDTTRLTVAEELASLRDTHAPGGTFEVYVAGAGTWCRTVSAEAAAANLHLPPHGKALWRIIDDSGAVRYTPPEDP